MFHISKHIFKHLEFFALGAPEPDYVLPNLELDAVAQFVTDFDIEIKEVAIQGECWAMCDVTRTPSLCNVVNIRVAEPVVKTPPKRNFYSDAMFIQGGASNPRAIVNTIQDFMKGPLKDFGTDALRSDPGLRLMVHQLAYLMNVYEMDSRPLIYSEVCEACVKLGKGEPQ